MKGVRYGRRVPSGGGGLRLIELVVVIGVLALFGKCWSRGFSGPARRAGGRSVPTCSDADRSGTSNYEYTSKHRQRA